MAKEDISFSAGRKEQSADTADDAAASGKALSQEVDLAGAATPNGHSGQRSGHSSHKARGEATEDREETVVS